MMLAQSAYSSQLTPHVYFDSHAFAHSETSSIKQIVVDDFEGRIFDGGEHSFTHNLWEKGFKYLGLKVAWIYRYDYALDYSQDTAELIYADKNGKALDDGRNFEVELHVKHAESKGFKVGYEFSLHSAMNVEIDISYLEANHYIDGSLKGDFAVNDNQYSGQLELDYMYDEDDLLERKVSGPKGKGYAIDLAWQWKMSDSTELRGKWTDLLSEIKFDEVPFTSANATSDRVSLDDKGRIDVKPALVGLEGFRNKKFKFPKRVELVLTNQYTPGQYLSARWSRYGEINFGGVGWDYQLSDTFLAKTAFDLTSKALTLGIEHSYWQFSIISDRFKLSQARTFGLSISANYLF